MILSALSILTLLAAGYVITGNWWCVFLSLVKGKPESWIPLIGGGSARVGGMEIQRQAQENNHSSTALAIEKERYDIKPNCVLYFLAPRAKGPVVLQAQAIAKRWPGYAVPQQVPSA